MKFPVSQKGIVIRVSELCFHQGKMFLKERLGETPPLLLVHTGEVGGERRHSQCVLKQLNILCCGHAGEQAPGHRIHGGCQEELPRDGETAESASSKSIGSICLCSLTVLPPFIHPL